MKKRTVSILLSLLLMLSLVVSVNAAGFVDENAKASLTMNCYDGEKPLNGVQVSVYQVASVDQYGRYTILEAFRTDSITNFVDPVENGYFLNQDEDTWKGIAKDLRGYILTQKIEATQSAETVEGTVTFTELPVGAYLVVAKEHVQYGRTHNMDPYLIALPQVNDNNEWAYDVSITANGKFISKDILSDPMDSYRLLKAWVIGEGDDQDEEPTQPNSITVNVYDEDGDLVRTVTLGESNNWAKTITLDADQAYVFVEESVDGYSTHIEYIDEKGVTYVTITNTWNGLEEPEIPEEPENPAEPPAPPVEPEQPELPATGALWWPVPLMAVLGIACFLMGWMRRRNYEN